MRGTGSVVFFMVGVGILYFAWNSHVIDAALAFVFNPTQKALNDGPTLSQIVRSGATTSVSGTDAVAQGQSGWGAIA